MSAPRAKRQFAGAASDPAQRQITSFFTATGNGSGPQPPASSLRPALPAETQSNLLNVGMRVRKSVPEGYKTGNAYSAFDLFNDLGTTKVSASAPISRAPSSSCPSQRELLPFCGINKIGGLSSQPSFSFHAPNDASSAVAPHIFQSGSLPDINNVPALSSSQDSIASTNGLALNTGLTQNRKRVYDDGDESDTPSLSECLQVPNGEWMDGQVSPRSLVPLGWENTRVMAVPKGKGRRSLPRGGADSSVTIAGVDEKALGQLDQENMMVDDDFTEADFLDYRALGGENSMEI